MAGYESFEPTFKASMALNGPRSFSASAPGPAYSKAHTSTAWSIVSSHGEAEGNRLLTSVVLMDVFITMDP